MKRGEQSFYGAIEKAISYAKFLSSNIHDPDQRVQLWLNYPKHLAGNHENCIHPNQIAKRGMEASRLREGLDYASLRLGFARRPLSGM